MVQRHKAELADSLPEVDFFLGSSEAERLVPELSRLRHVSRARALESFLG